MQKGVVLLGDAKRRCDSSCRDDFFLSQNGVGNKSVAWNVAGYVTLCNFSCNLCRHNIARQVAVQIA